MIEIHDNFLNKKDFDKLLEAFTQNNTPFYLQKSIIEYPFFFICSHLATILYKLFK